MDNQNKPVAEFLKSLAKSPAKPLSSDLIFHSTFTANGKQGMVGLLEYGGQKYVYKISQYLNYLSLHEGDVMKCMENIIDFCPHFGRVVGCFPAKIDPNFRKLENPFVITSKYPVDMDVLVMEYLEDTRKLYRYIKKRSMDEEVIHSLIQQTLCALLASQHYCKFTHYDLHSNNVMVRRCDPNQVSVYRMAADKLYFIPTYGFQPVIIDFGFSYCKDLDGKPIRAALAHTNVGFMTNTFDLWSDFKLFLITTSYEMEQYHKRGTGKKFRKLVKKMFEPLSVEMDSGWDTGEEMSASDYALEVLEENVKSDFFDECIHFCIDILQSISTLPLEPHHYEDILTAYQVMEAEFMKIEDEIGSKFFLLYIFKGIVDGARKVDAMYSNPETRNEAVKQFRHSVYAVLDSVSKFSKPKVNYERLLCSTLLLGKQITGIVHDICKDRMRRKKKEYKNLSYHHPVEMFHTIHEQFGFDWEADENTFFQIYDYTRKTSYKVTLEEDEIDLFNEGSYEERSAIISKKLNQ
jgi:serine/threonine protein kinase